MSNTRHSDYEFFLGGHDVEMITIRDLLVEVAANHLHDKGLNWGAKASHYRSEIADSLRKGRTPVLIELEQDIELDQQRIILINHHEERSGIEQPTSLQQVFRLLELPQEQWTRWNELVAANDREYIDGMLKIGATKEEIMEIRAADRLAQGITPEEEISGEHAISEAEELRGGFLTVVYLAHSKTSVVTDRLHPALGGRGYENLLVSCPDQVNFYGSGDCIYALNEAFPGGWYGGALPVRGFWGHLGNPPELVPFLLGQAEKTQTFTKP